jgi:hypothetical protein
MRYYAVWTGKFSPSLEGSYRLRLQGEAGKEESLFFARFTMKKHAQWFVETSVTIYPATLRNIQGDFNRQQHGCESLKSLMSD